MAAIAPNEAELRCLQRELGTDLDLVLFVNDLTPDEDTEAADLTEPSGGGYAPIEIVAWPTGWTITAGDPTTAEATVASWDLVSGTVPTVYGWALVERGSPDRIVRVERFATPKTVASLPGGRLAIRPRVTAS
jgi:hypothetical protein